MEITKEKTYRVGASRVVLDVNIMDGNLGVIKVSLNGQELRKADRIGALDLGLGANLAGKTLQIAAPVSVTNAAAGRAGLRLHMGGGLGDLDDDVTTLANPGAVVDFVIYVEFIGGA